MKIRQHIPNFVSGIDQAEGEFTDLPSLLALPFVANWKTDQLARLSHTNLGESDLLMAEMVDGRWWVVGYIRPAGEVAAFLPVWQKPQPQPQAIPAGPVPPTAAPHAS